MRSRFAYVRPSSLQEALDFLGRQGERTRLLAGGTDLMIAVRDGEMKGEYVLDISRLDEIKGIGEREGRLVVGAGATYTQIIDSPLVRRLAPVLAQAAACVGSVQVRNVGTLGGNVANASPAADGIPPLVVHQALVVVRSSSSTRTVPVEELVTGPYRTSLGPDEMITEFLLEPLPRGWGYGFQRVARRRALAIARINAAALGTVDSSGVVGSVRIAVGSVTPRPTRMKEAEDHLRGREPSFELLREAAALVSQEMVRLSGVRASTEYKKPAVEGVVIKTLGQVFGLMDTYER